MLANYLGRSVQVIIQPRSGPSSMKVMLYGRLARGARGFVLLGDNGELIASLDFDEEAARNLDWSGDYEWAGASRTEDHFGFEIGANLVTIGISTET